MYLPWNEKRKISSSFLKSVLSLFWLWKHHHQRGNCLRNNRPPPDFWLSPQIVCHSKCLITLVAVVWLFSTECSCVFPCKHHHHQRGNNSARWEIIGLLGSPGSSSHWNTIVVESDSNIWKLVRKLSLRLLVSQTYLSLKGRQPWSVTLWGRCGHRPGLS